MSGDLAYIYMAILAQAIADSREISAITDKPRFDLLSIMGRRVDSPSSDRIQVAQNIIELKLPANLSKISIDQIIRLRSGSDFKDQLKAFHTELDKFYDRIEAGETELDLVKSFDQIYKDFSDEIVKLGVGTATVLLGVWILASSTATTSAQVAKEILGYSALAVNSVIGIRNTWNNTQTKRYCRRYLASLNKIKPYSR